MNETIIEYSFKTDFFEGCIPLGARIRDFNAIPSKRLSVYFSFLKGIDNLCACT